jgi:hypothetical protein
MKKKLVVLRKFMYFLFIFGTIITLWIVYRNLNYSWTYPFVIGYLILLFLIVIYLLFTTLLNMRNMTRVEVKKSKNFFWSIFVLLGCKRSPIVFYKR